MRRTGPPRPNGSLRTAVALSAFAVCAAVRGEERTGERIYATQCASCHGAKGEGVEDAYAKPLIGDKAIVELAKVIDETMPEGEPEVLDAADAAKVAAYLYDAFYSPDAQTRNAPPRIALSRLTVRQYENAVADLIGSFGRRPGEVGEKRGLKAEYAKGVPMVSRQRVYDQVDRTVDFAFGEGESPNKEKLGTEEFAMSWSGSVLAPETGDYEFVIETENGALLNVNGGRRPVIDASVKSGADTVYRGSLRLLGGRAYPIRLEFFKTKSQKTASIRLKWKPPHAAEQVIPERCLSPDEVGPGYVVTAPFPPDDRSTGFERGTSVSAEWDAATTNAALDVADHVTGRLSEFAGTKGDEADRDKKLREFGVRFAERAFRRPLTDEQKAFFIDRQFEGTDPETAVKRVVLLALKSPRFLYREVGTPEFDAYDAASRLSFTLWDSLPDERLLDAAKKDQLKTPDQLRGQAERMVADPRTRSKVRVFLHQWLKVDRMTELSKDGELYPGFDEAVVSDLRTSLDLFLDDVVWGDASDFRRLLLDESVYLNGRLAKFYGADLPADADFQKVSLEPNLRAGVLTHPYLLSGFAYHATTSPIHRGVFVARSVLGRRLNPPPEAVSPLAPDLHPDLSTRERVALQTSGVNCRSCHEMINPLGFALERFDAVGRFRENEKGQPIDATGAYVSQAGETVGFDGPRELAAFLAGSGETHAAFVEQLFQYETKQPIRAFGTNRPSDLTRSFADRGFDLRKLLVDIAVVAASIGETPKK